MLKVINKVDRYLLQVNLNLKIILSNLLQVTCKM